MAASPRGPQQVFCPHCRGGNPPAARNCMWCGTPLAGYPPNKYQVAAQPPKANSRIGCWVGALLVGIVAICLLCSPISFWQGFFQGFTQSYSDAADPPELATPDRLTRLSATPGPRYAEYVRNKQSMTEVAWGQYITTLRGTYITNWEGEVQDATQGDDGAYNLAVVVDGPKEGGSSQRIEVVVKLPASDAKKYTKRQRVLVSGFIYRIECLFGPCEVIVERATIETR